MTRPAGQAEPLGTALRDRGFDVVERPLVAVEPLSNEPIAVEGYDWVVVTSANGSRELASRATRRPARIAAIGQATATALGDWQADLIADVHTQEGLIADFPTPPGRVLFVGAEGARSHLADELGADFLAAYRTVELEVEELPDADLVLLASPSAARALAATGTAAEKAARWPTRSWPRSRPRAAMPLRTMTA